MAAEAATKGNQHEEDHKDVCRRWDPMKDVSAQLGQCPVCSHFSVIRGVCRWPHCYTHEHEDYSSDRFRRKP